MARRVSAATVWPRSRLAEPRRERDPQIRPSRFDVRDPIPGQNRIKLAADGFNFWQLGHASKPTRSVAEVMAAPRVQARIQG